MPVPTRVKKRELGFTILLAASLGVTGAGCSGLSASRSVSPLDFLLPGLHIQNHPTVPILPQETNAPVRLAHASEALA